MKKEPCNYLEIVPNRCYYVNNYSEIEKQKTGERINFRPAHSLAVCTASGIDGGSGRVVKDCPKNKNPHIIDKNCWALSPRDEYGNIRKK